MHKILVVEDEAEILAEIVEVLEDEGYAVRAVDNVEAALDLVRGGSFDLVLTDIKMPGASGIDLVKTLRKEQLPLRFVLMSGHESFGFEDRTVDTSEQLAEVFTRELGGRVGFIRKPFSIDHLLGLIEGELHKPPQG